MQTLRETERILKVLANRRRLAILKLLNNKGATRVGAVAEEIKLSLKATSKHLGVLSAAGVVESEQIGPTMEYYLKSPIHKLTKLALDNF